MVNFIPEIYEQKGKVIKKKKRIYFKLKCLNKELKKIIGNNGLYLNI